MKLREGSLVSHEKFGKGIDTKIRNKYLVLILVQIIGAFIFYGLDGYLFSLKLVK